MARENYSEIIAHNITELRKKAGMTQAKLAEVLGYSDKSVSKWERAEGIPDVICLKNMADLFGVTVDYFLESEHELREENGGISVELSSGSSQKSAKYVTSHAAITAISIIGVAVVAAAIFLILKICDVNSYLPFVIALPIEGLLGVIFNALWGKKSLYFPLITLFVAAIIFMIAFILKIWEIMLFVIPSAAIVWLACRVKKRVE